MQHFLLPPFKIEFNEGTPEKIQLMRVGSFFDERYGKVDITSAHLLSMMENFNNKVRGVDLALDFSHKSDGPAAGWIRRIDLNEEQTEMWAEIDWTNAGKENLLGKEFRYVSPDFTFAYKDNETLVEYGAVLLGAGLTNRPVIKNMAPAISLQELKEQIYKEGETMTPEEIAAMKAENEKMKAELAVLKAKAAPTEDDKELEIKTNEGEDMADKELLKKSADQEAKILALEAEVKEKNDKIEMAEKSKKFDVMLSEGKAVEAQRDAFIKNDMTDFVAKAMPVKMSEIGDGGQGTDKLDKTDTTSQIMKLAEAHVAKGKSLSDSIKLVLGENAELRKKYETEVTI